jgi:predicted phosphate transport protein (TIGR00153 family)
MGPISKMLLVSNKKIKKISANLSEYMDASAATLEKFIEFIAYFFENKIDAHTETLVCVIDDYEQHCDELKRRLEHEIFTKALTPNVRADLLRIVEAIDQIPNHCQDVANMMLDQKTKILEDNKEDVKKLLSMIFDAFSLTAVSVGDIFFKRDRAIELSEKINSINLKAVKIKRAMVKRIYSDSEMETHPGSRLMQKEIAAKIGEMGHLCKFLSERIIIASIKQHV